MARLCPSLLLLVAAVVLVSKGVHAWGSPMVVRKFQDIPETYVYVQQALWFAMKEYNKISKDKYIFKVVKVLKSQEQAYPGCSREENFDKFISGSIPLSPLKNINVMAGEKSGINDRGSVHPSGDQIKIVMETESSSKEKSEKFKKSKKSPCNSRRKDGTRMQSCLVLSS